MNITVIGSGYVGLVSGACFAEMGNTVTCVDIDSVKIEKLKQGLIPIFEPGLEQMVLKNVKNKSLLFTTNLGEAISDAEIVFIAVGTPMGDDGSADLQYVLAVAKSIGQIDANRLDCRRQIHGTCWNCRSSKSDNSKRIRLQRNSDLEFDVVSNPEFLKEGVRLTTL